MIIARLGKAYLNFQRCILPPGKRLANLSYYRLYLVGFLLFLMKLLLFFLL